MIPIARLGLLRAGPALRRVTPTVGMRVARITPPAVLSYQLSFARHFADSKGPAKPVSDARPAEELLPAMSSARKEARAVASDIARTIAGGDPASVSRETHASSISGGEEEMIEDFASITRNIAAEVPKPVLYTGLIGAAPYIGTAAATLYYARQAGLAFSGALEGVTVSPETAMAILNGCAHLQVTYGAVLLSFLGALHWGMEIAQYGGEKGYKRLLLGVAPVAFGWSTLAFEPTFALALQWFGFTAMWYADLQATNAGWTPRWFSQYRFYLSILIGVCMISTLVGMNFFGAWTGSSPRSHKVEEIAERQRGTPGRIEGSYQGEVEAIDGETVASEHYVIIKSVGEEAETEEESSEEGGEEKTDETHERQVEKDVHQAETSPEGQKEDIKSS
ncbi:hypothetical protein DACRYDRAFT_23067 [Dacryopinax primogenitus]|uniref:Uncharacterized protein n=1 Tax=Dacryopinax primogenitus (strain DJM 731) TaxID=1858805 RepID=M5GA23_DACPD|nr:uncharacterized protein DACRYDRAFT_23067 [Dacryopinax primogenitus]EJU00688.1 hypothetical protein DACRYDRAFT_23067 [Dacryopinax primogenitus]